MKNKDKIHLLSLGGSLIVPSLIDTGFLRRFRDVLMAALRRGHRFLIVTGGGQLTRDYQQAAKAIGKISDADLDWLGIATTKANAELLRAVFGASAHSRVESNPARKLARLKPVTVFSGWRPGWSTDYVAVRLAQTYGLKTLTNLSNVDYIYRADPRKHKNAKPYQRLNWRAYRRLVGSKWKPGANYPFDPVAARLAQKLGLRVAIINGRRLKNLEDLLAGRGWRGTLIE